ncbi:MAG: S8 family serine peptidase [Parvularculaceae bacterium]|nr:S8 family serine peptidase [Parvularculaceae bacterium]
MRKIVRIFAVLALCAGGTAVAQPAEETFAEALRRALEEAARSGEGCVDDACPENRSETVLPNAALGDFLETLPPDASLAPPAPAAVKVTSVSSDSIYRERVEGSITSGERGINQPLQDESRVLVMFRPNLTPAEAAQALSDYSLKVVKTLPLIGAVSVDGSAAIQRFGYASQTSATTLDKIHKSPVNRLVNRLRRDRRFEAVTVDAVLTTAQIKSAIEPRLRPQGEPGIGAGGSATAATERKDWGMAAAQITPAMWDLLTIPVTVGVIDDGFAVHEDLPFAPGSETVGRDRDHGNHVAGIMCATHDNGIGIMGVLPNCKVKAAIASIEVAEPELTGSSGDDVEDEIGNLTTLLAEYVGAVLLFMEANPDAKVVNISLGYNWMSNYGIDPRKRKYKRVRREVKNQGVFVRAILAVAKTRDVVIFSAAGNDSTDLSKPLEAMWASPFNYGSLEIEKLDGWTNGIIVESYAENLKRSNFSNVGGHIACPGSDILSTTALSPRSIGELSGTSMASPYCAAAFAGLRSMFGQLTVRQLLACFLNPPKEIGGRVPRMDLEDAFEKCRNL